MKFHWALVDISSLATRQQAKARGDRDFTHSATRTADGNAMLLTERAWLGSQIAGNLADQIAPNAAQTYTEDAGT